MSAEAFAPESPQPVMLDTGPLGVLANPDGKSPAVIEITRWLREQLARGVRVFLFVDARRWRDIPPEAENAGAGPRGEP